MIKREVIINGKKWIENVVETAVGDKGYNESSPSVIHVKLTRNVNCGKL